MLGFCIANPVAFCTMQSYRLYCSTLIEDDSPASLEEVGKFLKRYAKDPRKKVLWIKGLPTLRRIQQDWPAEKMADVLIGVFDVGEVLSSDPNIEIVDASLVPKSEADKEHLTFEMHRFDLEAVMKNGATGYALPKKTDKKAETPANPVDGAAKVKITRAPPDSLPELFTGMLEKVSEKKRLKVSGWIAARIEGALDKEDWKKALTLVDKYGGSSELVRAAVREFRDAGHLKHCREAVRKIVKDGTDLVEASKAAQARVVDVMWLDMHYPLNELTADMLLGGGESP